MAAEWPQWCSLGSVFVAQQTYGRTAMRLALASASTFTRKLVTLAEVGPPGAREKKDAYEDGVIFFLAQLDPTTGHEISMAHEVPVVGDTAAPVPGAYVSKHVGQCIAAGKRMHRRPGVKRRHWLSWGAPTLAHSN